VHLHILAQLPLAKQGNADAQNNLGAMYANGKGVSKDDKQAVYWYQKAAAQENTGAQYSSFFCF
jgi:TPR repeat protein